MRPPSGVDDEISMIEAIQEADQQWFLWLNSIHTPFLDQFMAWVTNKYTWIPCYVLLAIFLFIKFRWEGVRICLLIGLVILFCDQLTSGAMKPYFQRLRPCHDPSIASLVHVVEGCGGQYGFASSHAANAFGLATICWVFLRNLSPYFVGVFGWAALVSYSRIYMGVHYPSDILVGALVGIVLAMFVFLSYKRIRPSIMRILPEKYH